MICIQKTILTFLLTTLGILSATAAELTRQLNIHFNVKGANNCEYVLTNSKGEVLDGITVECLSGNFNVGSNSAVMVLDGNITSSPSLLLKLTGKELQHFAFGSFTAQTHIFSDLGENYYTSAEKNKNGYAHLNLSCSVGETEEVVPFANVEGEDFANAVHNEGVNGQNIRTFMMSAPQNVTLVGETLYLRIDVSGAINHMKVGTAYIGFEGITLEKQGGQDILNKYNSRHIHFSTPKGSATPTLTITDGAHSKVEGASATVSGNAFALRSRKVTGNHYEDLVVIDKEMTSGTTAELTFALSGLDGFQFDQVKLEMHSLYKSNKTYYYTYNSAVNPCPLKIEVFQSATPTFSETPDYTITSVTVSQAMGDASVEAIAPIDTNPTCGETHYVKLVFTGLEGGTDGAYIGIDDIIFRERTAAEKVEAFSKLHVSFNRDSNNNPIATVTNDEGNVIEGISATVSVEPGLMASAVRPKMLVSSNPVNNAGQISRYTLTINGGALLANQTFNHVDYCIHAFDSNLNPVSSGNATVNLRMLGNGEQIVAHNNVSIISDHEKVDEYTNVGMQAFSAEGTYTFVVEVTGNSSNDELYIGNDQVTICTAYDVKMSAVPHLNYVTTYAPDENVIIPSNSDARAFIVSEIGDTDVTMTYLADNMIAKGAGVIILSETQSEITLIPVKSAVPNAAMQMAKKDAASNGNYLVGTLTEGVVPAEEENAYILAKSKTTGEAVFGKLATGSGVKQNRAYLWLGGLQMSQAANFTMRFTGVTGVEDIVISVPTAPNAVADDVIYDLYGRSVQHPVKGNLYIKNGKKFYMK